MTPSVLIEPPGENMDVPSSSPPPHPSSLGLEKLGFAALAAPWLSALLIAALTGAAVMGFSEAQDR